MVDLPARGQVYGEPRPWSAHPLLLGMVKHAMGMRRLGQMRLMSGVRASGAIMVDVLATEIWPIVLVDDLDEMPLEPDP